jgi:hypothetical protein
MLSLLGFVAVAVTPEQLDIIQEAAKSVTDGLGAYGVVGAVAAALTAAVGVDRAAGLPWKTIPKWGRYLIVFAFSAVGSGMMSFLGGVGVAASIVAGVMAGLVAIGGVGMTKDIKRSLIPSNERDKHSLKIPMPKVGG